MANMIINKNNLNVPLQYAEQLQDDIVSMQLTIDNLRFFSLQDKSVIQKQNRLIVELLRIVLPHLQGEALQYYEAMLKEYELLNK